MHWIIQASVFKPGNYDLLVRALDALGIAHTTVAIKNGTLELEPEVDIAGKIYVCGAIRLAKIASQRRWFPGSFLNDQFSFDIWLQHLGEELLNHDVQTGTLAELDTARYGKFFIRPLEDNKAFDGKVIDNEMLADWRADPASARLMALPVIAAPVKKIYREYRLFVVNKKVVTGSVYKVAGKAEVSAMLEPEVLAYAEKIISLWTPADSFVMDVALCEHGWRVIEFNNINSSGFYASDVARYVEAIQHAYA